LQIDIEDKVCATGVFLRGQHWYCKSDTIGNQR
jgi:hypothetical protein